MGDDGGQQWSWRGGGDDDDDAAHNAMIHAERCRCMLSATYPNENSTPASVCVHHPLLPCARLPSIITVACA